MIRLLIVAMMMIFYYVRLLDENNIVVDLLFCKSVIGSTKAQVLFEMLYKLITENDWDLEKCISTCMELDQCLVAM